MPNKEMVNGKEQRKEIYYITQTAVGGGKVSQPWDIDMSFKFK
jgi:hypothetical protein